MSRICGINLSKINLQLNFNVLPLHVVFEKINLMKMKISTRVG